MYLLPLQRADLDGQIMYLDAVPRGGLLDVGCGDGRFIELMTSLGWSAQGIDPDPIAVERARARNLAVQLGTLQQGTYRDNTFDAITLSHVIEHVSTPLSLLRECGKILIRGGTLVVTTPNPRSFGARLYGRDWLHWDPPRHLTLSPRELLVRLATEAGLEVITATTTVREANGVFLASASIRRTSMESAAIEHRPVRRRWSRVLQALEWLLLKFRDDLGEETLLICRKR